MSRVSIFVDGFNLYHSLEDVRAYHKYKWLDLEKLAKCFISPHDTIEDLFYFTTYATWAPTKVAKHKDYVSALRTVNVKPVFGAFRYRDKKCQKCNRVYKTWEEKRTDVNIAIQLFSTAINDKWDKAFIVSGDSDLIPAIEAVKQIFPGKQIGIIIPIRRRAEELKQVADYHMKIKEKHLKTCQFPDNVHIGNGVNVQKPSSWH
jgi:uncharacterized LabA/DUF88 family protein